MKSNIKALLPAVYRGFLETDALAAAGDAQFDAWYAAMEEARRDQFAACAGLWGLDALERIWGPSPFAPEDVAARRQRLLLLMALHAPYTLRFLRARLAELFGEGRCGAEVDYAGYTLRIAGEGLDRAWHDELLALLGRIKPANMALAWRARREAGSGLHLGAGMRCTRRYTIRQRGALPPDALERVHVGAAVRAYARGGVGR